MTDRPTTKERYSIETLTSRLIQSGVPASLHDGLIAYIQTGRPTGSFLRAVLAGDLFDATARADADNRTVLYNLTFFLINYAPVGCYGDADRVERWGDHRGLEGLE